MQATWLVTALSLVPLAFSEVPADEITALPGWEGRLPSRQFSGYLNVGAKHMHYWLVESETDSKTAPVLLWLNGGPGCSSLEGLIYEHGPFRVSSTDPNRLVRFRHSWSKLANVIYLETPVGVGFSYSDDPADYNTNDDVTAKVNVETMNAFFAAWPEWKGNQFFIAGFSYGGIYVPTLAEGILWAEGNGTWRGAALKGIAVGNGCTGQDYDFDGRAAQHETEFFLRTAFVNNTLRNAIRRTCDWSKAPLSSECEELRRIMSASIGPVNSYNVDRECLSGNMECPCYGAPSSKVPEPLVSETCYGASAHGEDYLNEPSVHAAAHLVVQSYKWSACAGNRISYKRTRRDLPRDTYPFLIDSIKVTIYNGDRDTSVPYTGDEAWTEGMGYVAKTPWHPWTYGDNQVAGYATVYEKNDFTFVTVKGAGHLMPVDAPEQAFEMIRRVLSLEGFKESGPSPVATLVV